MSGPGPAPRPQRSERGRTTRRVSKPSWTPPTKHPNRERWMFVERNPSKIKRLFRRRPALQSRPCAITLCGALTAAELTTLLPHAGASYHIIREGFGPFPAFLKIWIEMWVSGPGSVAGLAVVLGEFAVRLLGRPSIPAPAWGALAIAAFAAINLLGIQWGGRAQVALTSIKLAGLLLLVGGSLLLTDAAASP